MIKDRLKYLSWYELINGFAPNEIKAACEELLEKYGKEEDKESLYLKYSNATLSEKIELIADNLDALIAGYTYEFIKSSNGECVSSAIEFCKDIYLKWCGYISILKDERKTDRRIFLEILLDSYLGASSLDFSNDSEPLQILQKDLVKLILRLLDLRDDKSADTIWTFVKRDYSTMNQANIGILEVLLKCEYYSETYYSELEKNFYYLLEHIGVWTFDIDVKQILQSMLDLFDFRGDTFHDRKSFYDRWESFEIVKMDKMKNEIYYLYAHRKYRECVEKLEEFKLKLEIGSEKWKDASLNLIKLYRLLSDNKNLAEAIKKYVSEIQQPDYTLFLELKELVPYDDWILFVERDNVVSLNEAVLVKLFLKCGIYSELFKCYEKHTELLNIQKIGKNLYEKDPDRYIALYIKALDLLYRELREKKKQENVIPHIRMFLTNYPALKEVQVLCSKWKQEPIAEEGFIRKIDALLFDIS